MTRKREREGRVDDLGGGDNEGQWVKVKVEQSESWDE